MKQKFLLSVALSAATLLATISCIKEGNLGISSGEVRFSSNISTVSRAAKAADNTWDVKDSIGIYMVGATSFNIIEGNENVPYITKEGGTSGFFEAKERTIYFPDNGSEVRFVSYYPYNSRTVSNIYKVDVSDQSNQSAIDLLYSFDQEALYAKSRQNRTVNLNFNHKLTKIIINIKAGRDIEDGDLEDMKISITGLNTKANFHLTNGVFINRSEIAAITPLRVPEKDGFYSSYEAIIIPTDGTPVGTKILFDLNNGEEGNERLFSWVIGSPLFGSYKYTYNVTINRSGIVALSLISDWIDDEENEIEAE